MTKTDVKIINSIITKECNSTLTFLTNKRKPVDVSTVKALVLNLRTTILTSIFTNDNISMRRNERQSINIIVTNNIKRLSELLNLCSDKVSRYYIGVYLNSTRDKCIKDIDEYYSENIHKEFTETLTKLFDVYTDMISD